MPCVGLIYKKLPTSISMVCNSRRINKCSDKINICYCSKHSFSKDARKMIFVSLYQSLTIFSVDLNFHVNWSMEE